MQPSISRLLFTGVALALCSQVHAASVSGQIEATLTLTSSCQVNGSAATSGLDFGTLSFGTQDAMFTQAAGQVLGSGGALSILCSSATQPVITVRAGAHDNMSSGGSRALFDGVNSYVPYDFYSDAGHTQLLAIDGTIALPTSTGVAQTVNLYALAQGKVGLPAGTYTDTVNVELSF